jgi:hypothetical protein
LESLVKNEFLEPLDISNFDVCVQCAKGKQIKIRKYEVKSVTDVLDLIHTDICGPFHTATRNGHIYFINFIDDYIRYGYIFLIKEKEQALQLFKSFKAEVEL